MERFVLKELTAWKKALNRKPLIVNGARQVGKTWALREFSRREYAKEAYVVCRKSSMVEQAFRQDFDVERILRALRALTGVDITPGDTLIILDEVQEVPEAIESLKYFCEQAPSYHIAVAGSLLGISMHEGVSFPVGKVDFVNVWPMNFEEFLLAAGETEACKALASKDYAVTNILHERYCDLLRQYFYVGGMPEAVQEYVLTGALQEVRHIQDRILHGYESDFSKHAPREQVARIRQVWRNMPSQLFKENKKFIYNVMRTGARAKDFELALEWLMDAGLLHKVPRCSKPALPLPAYEDTTAFKMFLLDVGLLGAMAKAEPQHVLLADDVFTEYKGGMAEQFVMQQLTSRATSPIYYHTTDDSRLELDFLIQSEGQLVPIEVKAGRNVRANSLTRFLSQHPEMKAHRYSMLPYREQGQLVCLPLYAV